MLKMSPVKLRVYQKSKYTVWAAKGLKTLLLVLPVVVLLASQQVGAFTQNDFDCVSNTDCWYDAADCGPSASGSTPATTTSGGVNVNDQAAQQVAKQASSGGTNVGYALYDSTGKQLASYNAGFENYGASITKSMLLVAYLKQTGSGNLSSQAKSELTNMIENSDNASANWVYSNLNNAAGAVNNVASSAGMSGFHLDTSDPVYILGQSKVTADDFAKFFSKIDTMFPPSQKDFALNLLSNLSSADQNGLLQANLPGTVYSKEGWKDEPSGAEGAPYIVNQAAQFSSGNTTYGVAVTVGGTSDQSSGETIVKNVVSALVGNGGNNQPSGTTATSCCDSPYGLGVDSSTTGGNSGVWNSGLQPPYIVEQYAIEVLKDLATKKGASESNAVTQQHVLALVAWALIEGGDIMNSSLYNLYNTGYSSPQLDAGAHTANGLGSYKSFDAGVEATARTIASGHGGMVKVLLDPNSTAKDFAHAESYTGTSAYPGTSIWSGAGYSDPSGYENVTWANALQTVRGDYKHYAGTIIGTSAFEQQDNKTDESKVQFSGSGGSATDLTGGAGCSSLSGASAQSILQEALKLAWPDGSHGNVPKPEYRQALIQYNKGNYTGDIGNDCGVFVSTVVRAAGVDSDYPQSGTGAQWAYVVSHPAKYDVQYNVTDMSQLEPGDILIVGGPGGAGGAGHTWIYVGKQPGGYWSASASMGTRTGNLDNDTLSDSAASGNYMRVRVK